MMPVFAALTAALLALTLLIAQTIFAQQEARQRARAEGDMLLALHTVIAATLGAEASQRGYLLTRDPDYLTPYRDARQRLDQAMGAYRALSMRAGVSTDAQDFARVDRLTSAKFAELDQSIALARAGSFDAALALVTSDVGKPRMDSLRAEIVRQMEARARMRNVGFVRANAMESRLLPLIGILGVAIIALVIAGFRTERSRAHSAAEAEQAGALREANERTQLLARELNHRVKNLFSVVLSIVTLSGRKQASTAEIIGDIRARIHALSRAHSTSQGSGEQAMVELGPVIAQLMEPYADDESKRVRIDGAAVALPVRMVTPIGLILHELATNAAKYGALSANDGHVDIRWTVDQANGEPGALQLSWIETGGPALAFDSGAPVHAGFGSQMTVLAARQLGGTFDREWPASGAICRLTFPLPQG
jgi:two-component sensor histidine kinase/CHASE3 domain sensor protein